jgi:hypothetical protein
MKLPAKLLAIYRTLSPEVWIAGAMLSAVLLFGLWWILIAGPAQQRQQIAAAKVSSAFAASRSDAAADAAKATDKAHAAEASTEALSRETSDVIHAAPGADVRLDPALNRTARERLCQRASYRGTPDCVQLARRAKP